MNRETADKWCERVILGLVLLLLAYGPLAMGAVVPRHLLVLQFLTAALLLLWAARLWISPRPQLLWPPLNWAVLAFTGYAIARYCTSEIEYAARLELVKVILYASLYGVVLNNLYRQETQQWIVLLLVGLGMLLGGYALFQFVTGSNRVWMFTVQNAHRASGTYISPNHLAGFLEMVLPLGAAWTLVSRARPGLKVVTGYATCVILGGIAVTLSRGGWVASGAALVALFAILLRRPGYRIASAAMLILLAAAAAWFIPKTTLFHARIHELTAHNQINDSARTELWRPALQLWRTNPWWGIGPDHFNYRFRAFRPESIQLEPDRVHNDYLNTLVDWGIAGFALVAAAWVIFWLGVAQAWPAAAGGGSELGGRRSNRFALLLGSSIGLLAILVHSLLDFNMHIPANAAAAVTLMAVAASAFRYASDRCWVRLNPAPRAAVTLVLAAAAGWLGWQGCLRAQSQRWIDAAGRSPNFSSEQVANLEKAHAIEPRNFDVTYSIGEALRVQSWEGGSDYEDLATRAMGWFDKTRQLNPYHGYSYMRYGMCLDWLGRTNEAYPYFDRALLLDPNGYFTVAHLGWHYVQIGDYGAAGECFRRSKRLEYDENPIADAYLQIIKRKLVEGAKPPGKAD